MEEYGVGIVEWLGCEVYRKLKRGGGIGDVEAISEPQPLTLSLTKGRGEDDVRGGKRNGRSEE